MFVHIFHCLYSNLLCWYFVLLSPLLVHISHWTEEKIHSVLSGNWFYAPNPGIMQPDPFPPLQYFYHGLLHGSMIFAEFAAFQPIISGTKPTLDPFQIFEQMSKLKYIQCTFYWSIVVLCNILENFVHTITYTWAHLEQPLQNYKQVKIAIWH